MTLKQKFFSSYFAIGVVVALYQWVVGPTAYRGFFYNLGRGIIWPAILFPVIGKIIGAIVIVAVVTYLTFFVKSPSRSN
jgi:hypothetical protein